MSGEVPGRCDQEMAGIAFWVRNPAWMPDEVRKQVFKRSCSTKGRGRGLGLYCARLLARRYLRGEADQPW